MLSSLATTMQLAGDGDTATPAHLLRLVMINTIVAIILHIDSFSVCATSHIDSSSIGCESSSADRLGMLRCLLCAGSMVCDSCLLD